MIGERFDQYEILERLGGGGMGVVYKARDTNLDRTVALKFLPPELSRDEQAKERFKQEARAASALNHPNICAIHDIRETEDGRLFIVMALYEGETLKEELERGPNGVDDALSIIRQIADGLSVAHEAGIIHRDIKPANIILTDRRRAVILDFGLAKLASGPALTVTGSTLGTIAYMSPEQAQSTEVDHRTDLWAVGALMYELLSGQKPFRGDFDQAVIYNILNVDPAPPSSLNPDIPPEVETIVQKALQKDTDLRYDSADQLLADLEALDGGPRREPARDGLIGINAKKKQLTGVLGIVAIVAFAVGGFLSWDSASAGGIDSIAVMPLENLSGDDNQQFFADGMTEAMITELSKIGGLKVTSRRSAMRFKDAEMSAIEIADQLGVDALIQGSVIREGDDVRITARLISGSTDEHLWSDSFDRELRGILKLHAEVAQAIAREIKVNITPAEQERLASAHEVDPEAYESYLRGQHHLFRLGPDEVKTAEAYFKRALEIDPDFALAVLGMSSVFTVSRQMGYMPPQEATAKTADLLAQVLAMDSTLADAHLAVAIEETWTNWDWEAGERAFRRAIELNPSNSEARAFYSHLLNFLCRPDEAMQQIERAIELDPLNEFVRSLYAIDLLFAKQYDESIRQAQEVLKTSPSNMVALSAMKASYVASGEMERAFETMRRNNLAAGDSALVEVLDEAYARGGYRVASEAAARSLIARTGSSFVSPQWIAGHFVEAGLFDEAFPWLDKAFAAHEPNMPYIKGFAWYRQLRNDPRFIDLLDRMNLSVCSE